jgi:hypothetical protein
MGGLGQMDERINKGGKLFPSYKDAGRYDFDLDQQYYFVVNKLNNSILIYAVYPIKINGIKNNNKPMKKSEAIALFCLIAQFVNFRNFIQAIIVNKPNIGDEKKNM